MGEELDKETQRLTNFAKKYKESMSETGDLATQMLQTFKDINGILDKNTKNIDKSRSFQKQILSDAKARAMIEEQINSDIMSAEKELMKMKLAQIDNSHFLNELGKEYAGVMEKITTSENKLVLAKKELSKIDNDILESEKSKSAILAKQQDVIEKIENRHRALQKVEGSILANNKAILDNKTKQAGINAQLKVIEEEMDAAQIKSIHEGMDLTDEYNSMMKKREYLKNKLVGLDSIENQYKKDGLNLGYRKHALDTEILNAQDQIIEGNKELLPIDRSLVENREKQRIATKGILDLEGELNGMMKEKAKLEEQMLNPDDAISAKIKELELQIKQNQEAAKLAKQQAGFLAYMKDTAASSGGLLGNIAGMASKAKNVANSFKTIPGPFIILKALLEFSLDRFEKLDKAAEDFRKQTGFSNTQMVELRKNAESVNVELQEFGVGIEQAYSAAKALTDVFGNTSLVTKEAMANVALMNANLNVAVEDSAAVLATFQGLGGATQEAAMNMMKIGAGLSEKAGVPFSLVMKDIANASDQTLSMLSANPSKLMKASIAARALGTDMNKLVSSQRKLLDYSTSMNEELELSALLGKSVSFQLSRQLAYEGDIAGAAKATLETVKAAGDFDKMSVYQREALAKASGMELKDLTKMMAVDKQKEEIRLRGTDEQKRQLAIQEETLKKLEEENDLSKQGLLADGERAIQQQKMQGLMTKMKNLLESITVIAGDILEPLITPMVGILIPLLKVVAGAVKLILYPFKALVETIKWAAMGTSKLAMSFQPVKDVVEKIGNGFSWLSEQVSKLFGTTKEEGMSFEKGIGALAGAGALGWFFFGKGGFDKIMNMIKAPFKMVKDVGKNMLGKLTGKGAASDFIGPKLPDASAAGDGVGEAAKATKDVKSGSGIKDFLTNLASGLKKMGANGVVKGAMNLLLASPSLVTIIPGAVLSGLIPTKAGKNIESFLTGLAGGLKAMGTGRITGGAANLVLASVGLVTVIPGALLAGLIPKKSGENIESFLTGLAGGLKAMGTGRITGGAANLVLASAGLVMVIPGAIAAAVLGAIGKPIENGLKFLAKGIAYMGDTNVFKGALGIAAVGLSIIPFAFAMQMFSDVDWGSVGIGTLALIGFTAAAFGLGAILSSGAGAAIFGAGVIGIAALGASLIPFAAAALIAGAGVKMLGEGIASSVDPILRLSEIDLTNTALGIGAIGIALAAFGAGSAGAGLGSFVGGLLGGDPIAKMEKLASIGDKLKITADSITAIAQATSQFKAMDAFSESVTKLAESLGKLNNQISETNAVKLAALTAMTSTMAASTATSGESKSDKLDNSGIEAKLDKLTDLLVGGAVRVYIDGADVSSAIARI